MKNLSYAQGNEIKLAYKRLEACYATAFSVVFYAIYELRT